MNVQADGKPVVAIVGGGASGAGVAYHLARAGAVKPGQIVIFEPRTRLGAGLAYDTPDPAHRINVPSTKMSLLPNDLEHFQRWIDENDAIGADGQARSVQGHLFPRRHVFGDYINAMLQPLVDDGLVTHVRQWVRDIRRQGSRWIVTDAADGQVAADILVLATSHPSPIAPKSLSDALGRHPRFVADPTRSGALDAIRASDRVLIVGNGLTSADVVASLALGGHEGPITAISRRGLRSRGHAQVQQEPYGDFQRPPPATAMELLKRARDAIAQAEAEGLTWHAVVDQLRRQAGFFWTRLPVEERRRAVRHLRPFWDVHRFRIAPQVEAASEEAIRAGRLEILAASIASVRLHGEAIECELRLSRSTRRIARGFDAVVVTTGPGHKAILESQGWISALAQAGYLSLDRVGLGLACTAQSQAIGADGAAVPSLYISGPLARGTFGELMGLPEVSEHAVFVAERLAEDMVRLRC